MQNARNIWCLFAACVLALLAGMAWLSASALRLERSERSARQSADLEETVRLALWRLESAVSPLVARESARPYFHYSSFYPIERAYTNMFAEADYGDLLVPSPLLQPSSDEVLVYFQFDPDGRLSSPQSPPANLRALAERAGLQAEPVRRAEQRLEALRSSVSLAELAARLPPADDHAPALAMRLSEPDLAPPPQAPPQQRLQKDGGYQQFRGQSELDARQRALGNIQQQVLEDNRLFDGAPRSQLECPMRPVWAGDALLLARRVTVEGREFVQGCRLNWEALRERLTRELLDLLPHARLEPLTDAAAGAAPRRLAALPVRLLPGEPAATVRFEQATPLRLALLAAWVCVLTAVGAVAFVLRGTLVLSERRAAFVSAVTHELRTPLTSFRLYTDLLMASPALEAEKRTGYVATLRREALRLSHLVENVLAYARLERGRHPTRMQCLSLSALLEPMLPRLAERAGQAEMRVELALAGEERELRVLADPSAVEQILFNLVDNACKYARPEPGELARGAIRLSGAGVECGSGPGGARARRWVEVHVSDHGPGIDAADAPRLFRPFHKSARDAAHTAPGVGLGLALSRKLARAMGGDLRLLTPRARCDAADQSGARFVLTLPTARAAGRSSE